MRTDCPLIGGDSGGPLFDLSGRLIAIHSRVGAVTNSNTHIPVKVYQHQWESLKSGKLMGDGTFAHAGINFLGMHILEKDGEFHVLSVAEKTRASEAGVLAGDILLKLNGKKIDSGLALLKVLKSLDIRPEGIDLSLTFLRAGEAREVNFIFND